MNILVVEDKRNLADAICHILEQEGYNAEAAYDGKTGLAYAESGLYDAAILDVMLPGMDGFSIVRTLRQAQNDLPIMMLTAKTSTRDKVEGLDCGADDYMTKPFEAPELLARVRALTRRKGEMVIDAMEFGDLSLDLETHDLSCGDASAPPLEARVRRHAHAHEWHGPHRVQAGPAHTRVGSRRGRLGEAPSRRT